MSISTEEITGEIQKAQKIVSETTCPINRYNAIAGLSQFLRESGNVSGTRCGNGIIPSCSAVKSLGKVALAALHGGLILYSQAKLLATVTHVEQEKAVRAILSSQLGKRDTTSYLAHFVEMSTTVKQVRSKSRDPWSSQIPDEVILRELETLKASGKKTDYKDLLITPEKQTETEPPKIESGGGERRQIIREIRETTAAVTADGMLPPDIYKIVFGSGGGEDEIDKAIQLVFQAGGVEKPPTPKPRPEVVVSEASPEPKKNGKHPETPNFTGETIVCDHATTVTGEAICHVLSSTATLAGLLGRVRPCDLEEVLRHEEIEPRLKTLLKLVYKRLAEFEAIAHVFGWKIGT